MRSLHQAWSWTCACVRQAVRTYLRSPYALPTQAVRTTQSAGALGLYRPGTPCQDSGMFQGPCRVSTCRPHSADGGSFSFWARLEEMQH